MAIQNKQIKFTKQNLQYLKRDSILDFIYGIIRFFIIIIENIYCVSSYLVLSWILLLPISWIRNDVYSKAENFLYNSLLFIVSSWSLAAGETIVETGDEYKHLIDESEKYSKITKEDDDISRSEIIKCGTAKLAATATTEQNSNNKAIVANQQISEKTSHYQQAIGGDAFDNLKVSDSDCLKTINNNICNNSNNNFTTAPTTTTTTIPTTAINTDTITTTTTTTTTTIESSNYAISKQLLSTKQCSQIKQPRVLLLCNHISTADVPLIMQSFSTLANQSILWVLDAQFKLTNFGLVCSSHDDFFIAKNSFSDGALRDQVLKHPDRNLLVLFPEGGFFRKRIDGSNRYAVRNGLPLTKYVTHPRFGAFKDLIDPSVEVTHIVDATLLYDDMKNPLSILDIAMGSRKEPALLHYKVYKRSEINPTEEWLRNIWLEKDKLMQQYYEDRDKTLERFESTMRSAKIDWLKVFTVHLFYLLVCYLIVYRLTIKLRP